MNPTNEKVLVTGAGGFIGSHLVAALVETGASGRAFVRYNSRNDVGMLNDLESAVLAEVEICFGDFEDLNTLKSSVRGVDTVFHLGALIAIPYSYKHPGDVVHANVVGQPRLTFVRETRAGTLIPKRGSRWPETRFAGDLRRCRIVVGLAFRPPVRMVGRRGRRGLIHR